MFAFCQSEKEIFQLGNKQYQQGKYAEAIKSFEKIRSQNKVAAELYYNLGNAYYKSGDHVNAIVNYERALKLAPNDEDIIYNLHIANLKTIDKITTLPEFFITEWWHNVLYYFNSQIWSYLVIASAFIFAIALVLFKISKSYFAKKGFFILSLISFSLMIVFFVLANTSVRMKTQDQFAIIYKSSIYVKSSPDEKSTDLFILHQGVKLKVVDEIGIWRRIRLADGKEGWIKNEEISLI